MSAHPPALLCPPARLRCAGWAIATALLVLPGGDAQAAAAAPAPPHMAVAAVTLEVCQDETHGNWRYAGLVAVRNGAATATSVVRTAYWIQQRVSGMAYHDIVQARPLGAGGAAVGVSAFSIDAAPLPAGALRAMARISIHDPLQAAVPPITLEPTYLLTSAVCPCRAPGHCVRSQHDWRTPALAWPAPFVRTAAFHASAHNWQQVFDLAPSADDAYLALAQQYMAASLNIGSGATLPAGAQAILKQARAWLVRARPDSCIRASCEQQKAWAAILAAYNLGRYPGAPQQCPGAAPLLARGSGVN